jgi:hypothetical protein
MIGVAELAANPPLLDLDRDAARVGEVLWMEAEDANVPLVKFGDDGIRVLVVVDDVIA